MRKRIAILLTSVCLMTSFSADIMAASDNSLTYETKRVAEQSKFEDITTAPSLRIVFKDAISEGSSYRKEVFYLRITNARFIDLMFTRDTINTIGAQAIEKQSDTVAKITIVPESQTKEYIIPLLVELTGGDAGVYLESNGSDTTITTIKETGEHVEVEQEIKITESKELQDDQINSKVEVSFSLGKKNYILNGKQIEMDGEMYIADVGYTMVPLRYIAQSIGISEENISYANGIVTILTDKGALKISIDDKNAYLEDKLYEMSTIAVLKEGRTYVPIGEIAKILGIEVKWNNETKTATFINK